MLAAWLVKRIRYFERKRFEAIKESIRPYSLSYGVYVRPENLSLETWEKFQEYDLSLNADTHRVIEIEKIRGKK